MNFQSLKTKGLCPTPRCSPSLYRRTSQEQTALIASDSSPLPHSSFCSGLASASTKPLKQLLPRSQWPLHDKIQCKHFSLSSPPSWNTCFLGLCALFTFPVLHQLSLVSFQSPLLVNHLLEVLISTQFINSSKLFYHNMTSITIYRLLSKYRFLTQTSGL